MSAYVSEFAGENSTWYSVGLHWLFRFVSMTNIELDAPIFMDGPSFEMQWNRFPHLIRHTIHAAKSDLRTCSMGNVNVNAKNNK